MDFDAIVYPFIEKDSDGKIKEFILSQMRKEQQRTSNGTEFIQVLDDRGKRNVELSHRPTLLKWAQKPFCLDDFINQLKKAKFPETGDNNGYGMVCVKNLDINAEPPKSFDKLIGSYQNTKSPKKVIIPRCSRPPRKPVAWNFTQPKKKYSYYYQSIFFGPWFTYLHVDEYNHGKTMMLPEICQNSFKIWLFLRKNTHEQRQYVLREHKVIHAKGINPEQCEYEHLMDLINVVDLFEVFIQRPGDLLEHFHGCPHAVLTCYFDSRRPQYSILYGVDNHQVSAIISHISHPYSEVGREVRLGVKSYGASAKALLVDANRCAETREDFRVIEEHKERKKRKREHCASKLKGVCKMRNEAREAREARRH